MNVVLRLPAILCLLSLACCNVTYAQQAGVAAGPAAEGRPDEKPLDPRGRPDEKFVKVRRRLCLWSGNRLRRYQR